MKAKLIKKSEKHYDLRYENGGLYTSTYQWTSNGNLLSIKNCQAIERGYDLDELAKKFAIEQLADPNEYATSIYAATIENTYMHGFQKALELMVDKKFSEYDMLSFESFVSKWYDKAADVEEFTALPSELIIKWKSLQQTEWDVEIEMAPAMSNNGNVYYGDIPKLDADGYLILKRI